MPNKELLMEHGFKRCTFHHKEKCALSYMHCCIPLTDIKFGNGKRSKKCPFYTTKSSREIEEMINEARKKYKELRELYD